MERAQLSAQSHFYVGGHDRSEKSGSVRNDSILMANGSTNNFENFGDVSPLHANDERDTPERIDRGSPLPAIDVPLAQPLPNGYDIELNEGLQHSHQSVSLLDNEQSITRQDSGDTQRTSLGQQSTTQLKGYSLKTVARIGLGWDHFLQSIPRVWFKSWTTETCSYIIAILALAGLVATLSAHQGRPLPQWPQLVTINSIISLFSLIMRACVGVVLAEGSQCKWNWYRKAKRLDHIERLDSASRGSWGAVTLLYHFRPRQAYYLATMGAVITILASLTGFFAQQLVQFQDCLEKDPAALVNISRTNGYARTGGQIQSNVFVDYAPMVAAINVGVLQSPGDLTSALSSGCSSGNCTFSENGNASFSTIAISHLCQDTTPQIRVLNESKHTNSSNRNPETYLGLDYGQNQTFVWSKTPGGIVVMSWVATPVDGSDLITIHFLSRLSPYTDVWSAVNCTLFPTINTYAASINDAILKENLVENLPLKSLTAQFDQPPVIDGDFVNLRWSWGHMMTTKFTIRNGLRESCEGSSSPAPKLTKFLKRSDDRTYVNSTGHTNPSVGWKWWHFPTHCVWSIYRFSDLAMIETITEVFGNQNASMGRKMGVWGSAHLRVLFQDGNMTLNSVDERIQSLATAMTTIIRTNGGLGNTTNNPREEAIGTVWNNTTCMYIRWSWVAFPSAMIGLTGLFLLLVAFENRGVQTDRLWKSSFLAALFCEVEVQEKPVGKEEMKAMAKSTSVSLEDKRATLRLVTA
ncbi:hypothetical protein NX059_002862 [Plenodomus lindquistii]|nr:hypothetical protein NX059_002862 [Plenodomus lindquistii]